MSRAAPSLAILLAALAAPVLLAAPARADEWPPAREGWWEELRPGQRARYQVEARGMPLEMRFTVEAVEGTTVVLRVTTIVEGVEAGSEERRLDVREDFRGPGGQSPGASLTRLPDATLPLGDEQLECAVYEVDGLRPLKAWHSPRVPRVFLGGAARLELEGLTLQLLALEQAPAAGQPPLGGEHLAVGQRYHFQTSGDVSMVWEVLEVREDAVIYRSQTFLAGRPLGDPSPRLEWSPSDWAADEWAADEAAGEDAEPVELDGVGFDVVRTASELGEAATRTWLTYRAGRPVFPGMLRSETEAAGAVLAVELVRIEQPE